MTPRSLRRLVRGRDLSLVVVALAAAMLTTTGFAAVQPPQASAAENAGGLTLATPVGATGASDPVTEGGSALPLVLTLPNGAACTGDSASGGYRVQTFMVPASVDLETLRFGSNGPVKPAGAEGIWYPLFSTASNPLVNLLTDVATTPSGPGTISGLPLVDFAVYSPGDLPAGDYAVGVACTLGNQSAEDQLDRFWVVQMTFADDTEDPAGVAWTATTFQQPTTTTTTTDGDGDTTTTTAPGSSTTSTTPASTSSTTAGSGSSTSISGTGGGSGTATSSGSGTSSLPATGASSWLLVGWAFVLLVAGRMAWLFSRRTRVVDSST